MIMRQQGKDKEIDLFRGTVLVGHVFSTGAPGHPLELQVYTADYGRHTTVNKREEVDTWILYQLQGD